MGKTKARRKLFQTDLRKERTLSPYMDADDELRSWQESKSMSPLKSVENLLPNLLPMGFSLQQLDGQPRVARMERVDSYRAPPLRPTLETIEEDDHKPDYSSLYLRSKSLPTEQRRFSLDNTGHGLHRFPSYRPGQGDYLPGGCGVSMSGPILSSGYENYTCSARKHHRSRLARMRDALRSGRFRQALNNVLSRMRPTSRRSH